jgi:hypothetical protein
MTKERRAQLKAECDAKKATGGSTTFPVITVSKERVCTVAAPADWGPLPAPEPKPEPKPPQKPRVFYHSSHKWHRPGGYDAEPVQRRFFQWLTEKTSQTF